MYVRAAVAAASQEHERGWQISDEICHQIRARVFPFSLPVTASPWGWVFGVALGAIIDAPVRLVPKLTKLTILNVEGSEFRHFARRR